MTPLEFGAQYAGQTVNFSVAAFDPLKVRMEVEVVAFESEYGKVGGLYLTHTMKLVTLKAVAVVPPTPLTYTVTITDKEKGTGQIKFSHPINMVWLEDNFYDLFRIYMLEEEKPDV